jgi:protein-S-isoprenylcysteine O-methyltransferase Ste14
VLVFLIPLLLGFASNLASAFTTAFSHRWGSRRGRLVTVILRNITGIPLWALGFMLAFGMLSRPLFNASLVVRVSGWLLVGVGAVVICVALYSIRSKAVAPTMDDALVEHGLYAWMRHPIHSGTLLEFIGLFLTRPTLAVLTACVLGIAWVLLQTYFEERDLLKRMPVYSIYMRRVPAFFPGRWNAPFVKR